MTEMPALTKKSQIEQETVLPLRKGPVRFGVVNGEGLSSDSWKVWEEKDGSCYISCRNNMQRAHISLHASGVQHIRIEPILESGVLGTKILQGKWDELPHYGHPEIVPSFELLFPNWCLILPEDTRQKDSKWRKNQILVEASEDYPITVVGFYITDLDVRIKFGGEVPSCPLAILPLATDSPRKRLWVIAYQRAEGNLMEEVLDGISKINTQGLQAENLVNLKDGHGLSLFLSGPNNKGSQFGVTVPVNLRRLTGD